MASEYSPTTEFLMSHAQSAMTQANNEANRISGLAKPTMRAPHLNFTVTKPVIQPPPSFGDLFPGSGTEDATVAWLDTQADAWIAKYFPNINDCLKTLPDDWLCGVISGVTPLGYSQTYFDLVWHAARDRAGRTRRSEVAEIDAEFSGRGFNLPPGAYVAAVDQAEQRASDVVLEVNREQAIKDTEIKLQMLQFAVQQSLEYKTAIMTMLAGFYKMWADVPNQDIERARIRTAAVASLYSALSAYYQVEVSFEQLRLRAAEGKASTDIDVDRTQVGLFGADSSANAALGQAVRAFGDISAQASAAAGTLVAQIEAV